MKKLINIFESCRNRMIFMFPPLIAYIVVSILCLLEYNSMIIYQLILSGWLILACLFLGYIDYKRKQ